MPDAPADSYLFLHGLEGSGEGHWQRWLAPRLAGRGAAVAFPELPDPDDPDPAAWEGELERVLGELGEPPVPTIYDDVFPFTCSNVAQRLVAAPWPPEEDPTKLECVVKELKAEITHRLGVPAEGAVR